MSHPASKRELTASLIHGEVLLAPSPSQSRKQSNPQYIESGMNRRGLQ